MDIIETQPEFDLVYDYHHELWGSEKVKKCNYQEFDLRKLRHQNYMMTSCGVMRRSVFPGFDPALKRFQDWDLRMAKNGVHAKYLDLKIADVPVRTNGISGRTSLEEALTTIKKKHPDITAELPRKLF